MLGAHTGETSYDTPPRNFRNPLTSRGAMAFFAIGRASLCSFECPQNSPSQLEIVCVRHSPVHWVWKYPTWSRRSAEPLSMLLLQPTPKAFYRETACLTSERWVSLRSCEPQDKSLACGYRKGSYRLEGR